MEERYDSKDLIQNAVGSLAGAMVYAYQADVRGLSDSLPIPNVVLIVLTALALSFLIAYGIGVRRLGERKMRKVLGIPLRVIVHYSFAVLFSVIMLLILGICTLDTPLGLFVRRVAVLSLPSALLGSAVDLVGSQKD